MVCLLRFSPSLVFFLVHFFRFFLGCWNPWIFFPNKKRRGLRAQKTLEREEEDIGLCHKKYRDAIVALCQLQNGA
jgi:hypothetical protein